MSWIHYLESRHSEGVLSSRSLRQFKKQYDRMDAEAKSEIDSAYTSEALNEKRNLQESIGQETGIENIVLSKREKIIANISGVFGFIFFTMFLAVFLQGKIGGALILMIPFGGFYLFKHLAISIQVQRKH